jgi:hypothetical protein
MLPSLNVILINVLDDVDPLRPQMPERIFEKARVRFVRMQSIVDYNVNALAKVWLFPEFFDRIGARLITVVARDPHLAEKYISIDICSDNSRFRKQSSPTPERSARYTRRAHGGRHFRVVSAQP